MQYPDARIIYGTAELTKNWPLYRENLFRYACNSDDRRWREKEFREYMYEEYINTETPITMRAYNLDDRNLKTLTDFIDNVF